MGFFGLKTSKEVEEEKRKAAAAAASVAAAATRENMIRQNNTSLSNLAKGSQINFVIQCFDVFDPRFTDIGVPVSVHGTLAYSIYDMELFKSINKTERYSDEAFQKKLESTVTKFVKHVVANAPSDAQIPVVQLERRILEISTMVQNYVTPQVERLFGITVRNIDIRQIYIDKRSRGYQELRAVTADLEKENILARHHVNLSSYTLEHELQCDQLRRQHEMQLGNLEETQSMQLEHQREMLRIQREEMQRASRLQTEQTFLGAHQANLNAGVTGHTYERPRNLYQQEPSYFQEEEYYVDDDPWKKMPAMPKKSMTIPQVQYMVGVNGQQAGPFDWNQLQNLVQEGLLTTQTYVWKQGMLNWEFAGNVPELAPLFHSSAPPMPGLPPMM